MIGLHLTSWSLLLVLAHEYTHAHVHLLLLTFLVMIGGAVITYADPQFVRVGEWEVTGWQLCVGDLILHQLPFWFIYWKYGREYLDGKKNHSPQIAAVVCILALYLMINNPIERYYFCEGTLFILLSTAAAVVAAAALSSASADATA